MAPFRLRLIATDAVIVFAALGIGLMVSSRQTLWAIDPVVAIYGTPVAIGLLWIAMLFLRGSYEQGTIGLGSEEMRRVISATVYTFAVVAGISYLIRADVSRAYAFVSLPCGLVCIMGARFSWRKWLYTQRTAGRFLNKVVLVGPKPATLALSNKLTVDRRVGYDVVESIGLPGDAPGAMESWLDLIIEALHRSGASAVAIDPGELAPNGAVRQLAWRLEGRGIDLLISPGLLDVAGPRLTMRPASGLPLLHLDEAALSRSQRFAKRSLDIAGSCFAVLSLGPVMLACALAVRLSSPGPTIFRQQRIGRAGRTFTMLKFRTMIVDSDAEREALRAERHHNEPMFKLADDPRVTRAGRVLRRWSLDELPQLFNVLGGSMSLVGPRPHPLDDVNRYGVEAYRRLALKPGMTGLWQVEGRSELGWTDALKLDIYYVERWSLTTDVLLLLRTVRAVIQGRGAV